MRLRDVAEVQWETAEQLYIGRFKGQRAIFLAASAKDRVDVFDVRDGIHARLDAFEQRLPPNVTLERGFDQTRNVGHRLKRLGLDFAIAITLVLLTLIPLGLRAATVVMISIPLSLSIGLAALYFSGFSLNQLSIAGFVLALGLLVDDSIVVVENIARYLRAGYSRVEAAIAATDQIALAVLGCTATLLFAFLPLLFLPEGSGLFIRSLPASVLYTVAASLFVALTVIPFLASRMLAVGARRRQPSTRATVRCRRSCGSSTASMRRRCAWRSRGRVARCSPRSRFVARVVRRRGGARLQPVPERRHPAVPHRDRDADRARASPTPTAPCASSRTSSRGTRRSATGSPTWATATRASTTTSSPRRPRPTRARCSSSSSASIPRRTPALLEELRHEVRRLPGRAHHRRGRTATARRSTRRSRSRSSGPDLDELQRYANEAEAIIAATPGTRDVDNPARRLRTDLDLNIDTDKAALLGVAPVEVDRTVRAAVAGLDGGQVPRDRTATSTTSRCGCRCRAASS